MNSMMIFRATDTVGAIVTRQPPLSRVFEDAGIEYRGGGETLEEAWPEACIRKE
jgi:hypothetical protein